MTKIKLLVLKEDIEKYDYTSSGECPITRALWRAGYEGYKSCVDVMFDSNNTSRTILEYEIHPMRMLNAIVVGMQRYAGMLEKLSIESNKIAKAYIQPPADIEMEMYLPL